MKNKRILLLMSENIESGFVYDLSTSISRLYDIRIAMPSSTSMFSIRHSDKFDCVIDLSSGIFTNLCSQAIVSKYMLDTTHMERIRIKSISDAVCEIEELRFLKINIDSFADYKNFIYVNTKTYDSNLFDIYLSNSVENGKIINFRNTWGVDLYEWNGKSLNLSGVSDNFNLIYRYKLIDNILEEVFKLCN